MKTKSESAEVFGRAAAHPLVELGNGDEVGEEDVGDEQRDAGEEPVLEDAFNDLGPLPGGFSSRRRRLGASPSIQRSNAAVDVFEEKKRSAGRPKPHQTRPKRAVMKKSEKPRPVMRKKGEPKILGSEGEAEEMETALHDIEKDGRMAAHGNPREQHVDPDQKGRRKAAARS